jgi:hypothetical protein
LVDWLRPPVVFGAMMVIAVVALLFHWLRQPPVSAAAILDRAIAAESKADAVVGVAQHHILRFEAHPRKAGASTASAHVEVWKNPRLHLRSVRLSGDSHPIEGVPATAWQTDLSAEDFAKHVGRDQLRAVEDATSIRLLSHGDDELRLARTDLHAIERTYRDESYVYRLVEEETHIVPESQVPAGILQAAAIPLETAPARGSVTAAVNVRDLEIEVLGLLNRAGALAVEDVTVSATANAVAVRAVVDSEQRKQELLRMFDTLGGTWLELHIRTVDEAVRDSLPPQGRVVVREIEVRSGDSPADAELRRLFQPEQARRFAEDILKHSMQARLHARAFQVLSASDPADPRVRAMLHEHATAIAEETATIKRHLVPVFPPAATSTADSDDAALHILVTRQDTLLRAIFSISSGAEQKPIDTNELWSAIAAVERAASSQ